ncbi:MAG: hypothetical protein IJ491_00325 [Clostridia bacterium]|nr:hypothetical protein [Clostridia bacterium]
MFSGIVCFCALLLILFGLFFAFYLVVAKLLSEDCDGFFIAVEGFEEKNTLSSEVYSAFVQVNMMNFGSKRPVYVIDYDLSENKRNELREAVEPYGKVVFLKIKENRFCED